MLPAVVGVPVAESPESVVVGTVGELAEVVGFVGVAVAAVVSPWVSPPLSPQAATVMSVATR